MSDSDGQTRVQCPLCRGQVARDAVKCPHCGSYVVPDARICPDCREPAPPEAAACRWCGYRWPDAEEQARGWDEDKKVIAQVWADGLGAMLTEPSITALFFPPELTVARGETRIRKWSFFGLRKYRQRIANNRIASVRALDGVLWGGIVIESYGGSALDLTITGLRKSEARQAAALIEQLATEARDHA